MNIEALIALIGIYIVINMVVLFNTSIEVMETGFNPIQVYRKYKVNWFGCTLLVILAHSSFLIVAIVFWFYKLCTCGRR